MFKLFRKRLRKQKHDWYVPGTTVTFTPIKQGRKLLRKIQKDGHG